MAEFAQRRSSDARSRDGAARRARSKRGMDIARRDQFAGSELGTPQATRRANAREGVSQSGANLGQAGNVVEG